MGGSGVPMIFSAVLTTLCRDFQSEALQLPYQTEMQLVSRLSMVPMVCSDQPRSSVTCTPRNLMLLVLGTGIWAAFKSRREQKKSKANKMEMALLGNRSISWMVGIFTMTATWTGGGTIIATAEMVYTPSIGLIEAGIMTLAYSISFVLCGLVFAKPLRELNCVTMMDPFYFKYGKVITAGLSLSSLCIDLTWFPLTLTALGGTMSVILDLSYNVCVWISASVAIIYTLLGGLYSVAYTDVIQLILIFISLWLCVPFVLMNPNTLDISQTLLNNTLHAPWIGEPDRNIFPRV